MQYCFTSYSRKVILPIPNQVTLGEVAQQIDAKTIEQAELRTQKNIRLTLKDEPYSVTIENCFTRDDMAFQQVNLHVSDTANALFLYLKPKLEHPGGYLMYP
jgi:hypothetical protein